MRLLMIGANHRTAGLDLREKLALSGSKLDAALDRLRAAFANAELVILSTCNRTEFYVAGASHVEPGAAALRVCLAQISGLDESAVAAATICRENEEAAAHLFRVSCGLDSMVLGENQVLGQVKCAYEHATGRGTVGRVLHPLFQQALTCAKQVRRETGIDSGRMSVGSVAVDFARRIFDSFEDKTVLGVGAGELAKLTLRHLRDLAPGQLWLANRSQDRAHAVAAQLELEGSAFGVRPFEDLDELLVAADIVVTGTGASEPIITAARFAPLLLRRRRRPLFVIDIAVPRDVEAAVGQFSNVYLYDIDDLNQVLDQTRQQRREVVSRCEQMVLEQVRATLAQIRHNDVGQLIRQLRQKLHGLGATEHRRTLNKLASASSGDVPALLEQHTQRLINKILHVPVSQMDQSDPEAPLAFYAAALRRLFDLEEQAQTEVDPAGRAEDALAEPHEVPTEDAANKGREISTVQPSARTKGD